MNNAWGFGRGGSSAATTSATIPGVSGFTTETVAGATALGLFSVTISNQSAVIATVLGSPLQPGATVGWEAADSLGLAAIAYDPGALGQLKITTQAYPT